MTPRQYLIKIMLIKKRMLNEILGEHLPVSFSLDDDIKEIKEEWSSYICRRIAYQMCKKISGLKSAYIILAVSCPWCQRYRVFDFENNREPQCFKCQIGLRHNICKYHYSSYSKICYLLNVHCKYDWREDLMNRILNLDFKGNECESKK